MTAGDRLGPYEILSLVGAGGMGEVYKARDTRLDRVVAIKISREKFSERFEREARAIAALNHPNICQLYDVGPNYLVMEFIDGAPLRGPLAAEKAVPLALQIAAALEAAHARGIVHRDLKPGNILITPSGAKLLDFGLAKREVHVSESDPTVDQTSLGTVLGSAAYMSPEQASGKTVDARSDIFSFGAVLYEMLGGQRAFEGESNIAMMAAVLRDEPYPLHSTPDLVQIVRRCLRKSPADRFQTMTEVKASVAAVKLDEPAPAIAVLPFANMSGDKEQEYFSDGLAEEIINALTQIPGLKVTARTSAFAFRGKEQDITKIAEALHVSTILEGSVRKSGNRLRVTAQLINAADGYHLWSQRYDRELADVFTMQDEIAAAIASALQLKLIGKPAGRRTHQPNLRAYEAFLRGRHLVFANTVESIAAARGAFEEAIALDPEYSEPYAELATWHFVQAFVHGLRAVRETMSAARAYAQNALELAPAEPRAHAVLAGVAALYDHDWNKAGERFRLALATEHVPPEVRFRCAVFYLAPLGRFREALDLIENVVEEDPLNIVFRGVFALVLGLESPDRAAAEARKAIEIDERHWMPNYAMSMHHLRRGELAEARQFAERSARAAPWMPLTAGLLAGILRRLEENDHAAELLSTLTAPSGLFMYYMVCSEIDAAADWFTKAIAQGEVQPLMWICADSFRFRSTPHWTALARMMNLPPEGHSYGARQIL
jgi:eukaryotic-like serine/threonine-protein kinase